MWIVRLALNRPYTFIVLALLILLASPVVIQRTPTDIFPNINIPVVAVAWQFTGLNPEEMEGRFTTGFERILTTIVDNIEHIESTTINGQSIIKDLSAAECQSRYRQRADHGGIAGRSAPVARRRAAPVDPQLQRFDACRFSSSLFPERAYPSSSSTTSA